MSSNIEIDVKIGGAVFTSVFPQEPRDLFSTERDIEKMQREAIAAAQTINDYIGRMLTATNNQQGEDNAHS